MKLPCILGEILYFNQKLIKFVTIGTSQNYEAKIRATNLVEVATFTYAHATKLSSNFCKL